MTLGAIPIAKRGNWSTPSRRTKLGYTRKHHSDRYSDNSCCGESARIRNVGTQGNDHPCQSDA